MSGEGEALFLIAGLSGSAVFWDEIVSGRRRVFLSRKAGAGLFGAAESLSDGTAASYPVPARRPEPPPVLRQATALMLVGAGLTIVSAVVFFATTDRYAGALVEATGAGRARVDAAVDEAEAQEIFRTVLGVGLWVWMAVKNGQGRKWARVVATVFGVINVAGFALGGALVSGLDSGEVAEYLLPQLIVGVVSVALGIVILVLLHRPAASQYYEAATRYEAALTLRGYR